MEEKPIEAFRDRKVEWSDKRYLQPRCWECDRLYARAYRFQFRWGMTIEEAQTMWDKQNGQCPICDIPVTLSVLHGGSTEVKWKAQKDCNGVIDHDHITGKVRGILCRECNFKLANIENKNYLNRALQYLEDTKNIDVGKVQYVRPNENILVSQRVWSRQVHKEKPTLQERRSRKGQNELG